jgi:hypothetical protein
LLLSAADPDKTSKAITVITTAPSLWIPLHVLPESTFLDVSDWLGSTVWQTGADVVDRVMARLATLDDLGS